VTAESLILLRLARGKHPLGKLLHHKNPFMAEATRLSNASPSRKHARATVWPLAHWSICVIHSLCQNDLFSFAPLLYPASEQLALLHGAGESLDS
jgi:hypothetical protein